MTHDRRDSHAKWRRAYQHYLLLEASVRDFIGRQCPLINFDRFDGPTGTDILWYLADVVPIRSDWPLVIGDCLFNLRCSLDHLVYELHVEHVDAPTLQIAERQSAFPISSDPSKLRVATIARLPSAIQDRILQMQPTPPVPERPWENWNGQMLGLLHDLQNLDKHRRLTTTWQFAAVIPRAEFPSEYGFVNEQLGHALFKGAGIARWHFDKFPEDGYIDTAETIRVLLNEGDAATDLLGTMSALLSSVGLVLKEFDEFLPSLPRTDFPLMT